MSSNVVVLLSGRSKLLLDVRFLSFFKPSVTLAKLFPLILFLFSLLIRFTLMTFRKSLLGGKTPTGCWNRIVSYLQEEKTLQLVIEKEEKFARARMSGVGGKVSLSIDFFTCSENISPFEANEQKFSQQQTLSRTIKNEIELEFINNSRTNECKFLKHFQNFPFPASGSFILRSSARSPTHPRTQLADPPHQLRSLFLFYHFTPSFAPFPQREFEGSERERTLCKYNITILPFVSSCME